VVEDVERQRVAPSLAQRPVTGGERFELGSTPAIRVVLGVIMRLGQVEDRVARDHVLEIDEARDAPAVPRGTTSRLPSWQSLWQ
jgi:hypothetical protein